MLKLYNTFKIYLPRGIFIWTNLLSYLLDSAYELIQYRIKEDKVIFHIASTITELECSFCGRKTSKVHSIYEREIQDLPMQGKKVILLVDTRKMRCMKLDCSHKTFLYQ